MAVDKKAFREKLEEVHTFPTLYMYKFIVPKDQVAQVEALFPKNEVQLKPSSGGKYMSATAKVMVSSSDQIIDTYEKAEKIKGLIAL